MKKIQVSKSNELAWADALKQGKYGQRRKPLGGEKLSASLWELAPGKKSFPFHAHHVTEEALFVVSGRGKLRTPEGEQPLGPGDYASFPAGGEAHQLINDGSEPLVYLGMSATSGYDIVEYPDSGKIASAVGAPPNGKRWVFRQATAAGYFDGEPDAQ